MTMRAQPVKTSAEEAIAARFPAFAARQAQWGGAEVAKAREDGFARFRANGLPNRRIEEWHYTDLRSMLREAAAPFEAFTDDLARKAAGEAAPIALEGAAHLLFVNGRYFADKAVSGKTVTGLEVVDLTAATSLPPAAAQALARDTAYAGNGAVALNRAFTNGGAMVRVLAGAPHIIHLDFRDIGSEAFSTFPHVIVDVAESAHVLIVESHRGSDGVAYQTNALIELKIATQAQVSYVRLNEAGSKSVSLATLGLDIADHATFNLFSLNTGAALSRHQIFLRSAGEQSSIELAGVTLARGKQHADTTLVVEHTAPRCKSREFYRYIIDDSATGVFQGKVVVAPDAQKTDGAMKSQTILLSDEAAMNNKPELEIFADDVLCGHGATCGSLDEDQLFYAHSRGLPPAQAQALLLEAFAGEALERVADEGLREQLRDKVCAWLAQRMIQ
jgi:Fe-S cluster assembly protein SufD